MKKELIAVALLLLMFIGTVYNVGYLEDKIDGISALVRASQKSLLDGDAAKAESELLDAIEMWDSSDGYTHIFIRHSEIDSTSSAFYEALGCVCSGDAGQARGAYGNLLSRLSGIVGIERIKLGSIF